MTEKRSTNRRTVLKTIGSGVAGGAVLAGSAAAASCSADTCIALEGHQFIPRNATVSLGDDGSATVQWTNKEPEQFDVPHDVHLENGATHLVHSSDDADQHDEYLLPGDSYAVEFSVDGADLVITERHDDSTSEETTATISDWGGSVKLGMRCEIHDEFTNMVGTLTVTE